MLTSSNQSGADPSSSPVSESLLAGETENGTSLSFSCRTCTTLPSNSSQYFLPNKITGDYVLSDVCLSRHTAQLSRASEEHAGEELRSAIVVDEDEGGIVAAGEQCCFILSARKRHP